MGLTGTRVLQLGLAGHAARSAPPRCPGLVRFPCFGQLDEPPRVLELQPHTNDTSILIMLT